MILTGDINLKEKRKFNKERIINNNMSIIIGLILREKD